MRCQRCQLPKTEVGVCKHCLRKLCARCGSHGCCGHRPAEYDHMEIIGPPLVPDGEGPDALETPCAVTPFDEDPLRLLDPDKGENGAG